MRVFNITLLVILISLIIIVAVFFSNEHIKCRKVRKVEKVSQKNITQEIRYLYTVYIPKKYVIFMYSILCTVYCRIIIVGITDLCSESF